jgi:hypothetical protein
MILAFSSCSKDDEINADDIIGEWTISSSSMNMTIDGVDVIQYLKAEFELTQDEAEEMYTTYFYYEITGTCEFKNDGTYTSNIEDEIDNGTWEINGSKLTMDKDAEDEMIMDINTLTSSKLVVSSTETDSQDINQDNTDETMVSKMQITFTK